jgi:hypothetical protein
MVHELINISQDETSQLFETYHTYHDTTKQNNHDAITRQECRGESYLLSFYMRVCVYTYL